MNSPNANEWHCVNSSGGYVDFEKELLSIPDEAATSVDIRLTFNVETRTCYCLIALRNDDGYPITWDREHSLPWTVGVAMIGNELAKGLDNENN